MGLGDFAAALGFGGGVNPVTAGIEMHELFKNKQPYKNFPTGVIAFQYFPERITDSKAANYASKDIPGGSHPIYTFVSGGERSLTFDAVFCNDDSGEGNPSGILGAAAALFGLGGGSGSSIKNNSRKDVVDINAAVNWLRAYTYPFYDGQGIAYPPPLAVLHLPGTGIVSADGIKDSFVGIITTVSITYEAFHRSGRPRIVVASVEFREVVNVGPRWKFTNGQKIIEIGKSYNRDHKSET